MANPVHYEPGGTVRVAGNLLHHFGSDLAYRHWDALPDNPPSRDSQPCLRTTTPHSQRTHRRACAAEKGANDPSVPGT